MGYDYVALRIYEPVSNYINNPDAANLKYYIIDPQGGGTVLNSHGRYIDTTQSYTQAEKDWYSQRMAWKSNDAFPSNIASGSWSASNKFVAMWDLQQQAVIDELVESEIILFKKFKSTSLPFTPAGYMTDETRLMGAFWKWDSALNKESFIKLSEWTGSDSTLLHSGITHEYVTYEEGLVAYYKKLNTRMKQEFPDSKWVIEPYRLYSTAGPYNEDWVYSIKNRADKDELIADLLFQEASGTEFVDDTNIFNSGVSITKNMVGSTQPNSVGEDKNRLYAAKAGINGAWFNWFGRFGGTGDMPSFTEITEVYPRLKLIRLIPNWDNLNNIPLVNRSWDGSVYQSKTSSGNLQSYISSDVMYSRHWKTGKLFAVFDTTNGKIKLNPNETITSIQKTDGYFIEAGDASTDFTVTSNTTGAEITLNSSVIIPVDSTTSQIKGVGYILTVSTSTSIATASYTSSTTVSLTLSASDTTAPAGTISINTNASYTNSTSVSLSLSATDSVGVIGYYLSTSNLTPTSGSTGWTTVTSNTSYSATIPYTLSTGDGAKTLYCWYKDSANNISTSSTDAITLDTTISTVTITSPTTSATYSTTTSTLNLSGTSSDTTSGLSSITWTSDKGGSGTATGTASWSVSSIALQVGANVITVTAKDNAGNSSTATLTVTYTAPTSGTTAFSVATYPTVAFTSSTQSKAENGGTAIITAQLSSASAKAVSIPFTTSGTATIGTDYSLTASSLSIPAGATSAALTITLTNDSTYETPDETVIITMGTPTNATQGTPIVHTLTITNDDPIPDTIKSTGSTLINSTTVPINSADTTAPAGTISINSDASYTNSASITLGLSATDNTGITGYYLSTSSAEPQTSALDWTEVTPATTSYSASVSYTLSNGDDTKTVYVWYKDAAGNVSTINQDSITLDTTAPTVSITNPTSSSTYASTTSTISLDGSALDTGSGLDALTYTLNSEAPATISGTASWSTASISLQSGTNTISVTAKDRAGNSATTSIVITYTILTTAVSPGSITYSDAAMLSRDDGWKHWYGIGWYGTIDENISYAKQMGHEYIKLAYGSWNRTQYANNANRAGLKFYIYNPTKLQDMIPVITKDVIDTTKTYTQEQVNFFERYFVWKSKDAFPKNIETAWHSSATLFRVRWDFQQQAVIDYVVEQFINLAKSYENTSVPFTFGGYLVDAPKLSGDFSIYEENSANPHNTYVSLSYWTGSDSGLTHGTITHEYVTYTEGNAAFYKQLNARMREVWPDAKWILEPYRLYSATALDEWIYAIKDRSDKNELTPDMLFQESSSTNFVDDNNIFNSGVNITKDRVGISQPNSVGEATNRLYAAKAGINGAWYNWLARFGGTGDMPAFNNITQVYPRLKLIRLIPNWDNLNTIPLSNRFWDGSVYESRTGTGNLQSHISSDLMYSRHPKTGKLFVVFSTASGKIKLNPGETVIAIQKIDDYFIESADAAAYFVITSDPTGTEIALKKSVVIPIDSTNGQVKGVGYIITLSALTSSKQTK